MLCGMDWVLVHSPDSCVEILTPHVMILEGGAFRRWLGHEGGAPIIGLVRRGQEQASPFFATCRSRSGSSPDTASAGALILNFSISKTVLETNFCCLSCPDLYSVIAARMDWDRMFVPTMALMLYRHSFDLISNPMRQVSYTPVLQMTKLRLRRG